jgi:hypothetical protein
MSPKTMAKWTKYDSGRNYKIRWHLKAIIQTCSYSTYVLFFNSGRCFITSRYKITWIFSHRYKHFVLLRMCFSGYRSTYVKTATHLTPDVLFLSAAFDSDFKLKLFALSLQGKADSRRERRFWKFPFFVSWSPARVARYFLVQCTKREKIYQMTTKLPNAHKIYQMALKYTKWP